MLQDSEEQSPTFHVVREVYETENAQETFINELDKALYARVDYIIIEPTRLGDETARWIAVGNCLHKTAVVTGLASVASGLIWPEKHFVSAPLCAISIIFTGLYTISWHYDPCCQYQVESDPKKLTKLRNLHEFAKPVVLVYTDNTRSRYLHRSVTILAAAFCAWRFYVSFK